MLGTNAKDSCKAFNIIILQYLFASTKEFLYEYYHVIISDNLY